jgi:hypothetical protein
VPTPCADWIFRGRRAGPFILPSACVTASAPDSGKTPAAHKVRSAARKAARVQQTLHAGAGLPARWSAPEARLRLQFGDTLMAPP